MDWNHLFTGFDGRISRQPFWIAAIILAVAAIALQLIVGFIFGQGFLGLLGSGILTLLFAYPFTALMVKRLHDRGKSGQLAWVFWAPTIVSFLGSLSGLTVSSEQIGDVIVPTPNLLGVSIGVVAMAVGIWALIELGILRGTAGQNDYGPDPLET